MLTPCEACCSICEEMEVGQKKVFIAENEVSETLLIPLYARAREQQQVPPLLIDKSAAQLVQRIDYDFQKFELAPMSMTGVVIRASYFDAIVRQFIEQHSESVVVHLGCGLDTRRQRLGVQAEKAHFYQIDVPEVITFRKSLLRPENNESLVPTCMFSTEWMGVLLKKHPKATFIFIIEGVLMYFSYTENKQLFENIAARFSGAEIHFDVISAWLSQHTYLHDAVRFTHAEFKFGVDNDKLFERWHPSLQYQGSFDLLSFEGWRNMSWPILMGQALFPSLKSAARVVAYLIK